MAIRNSEHDATIRPSVLGVLLAAFVFVFVWLVGLGLFTLFDNLRGMGNVKIQEVFRELVVSGLAGGFAMQAANTWIRQTSVRFVFFGFASLVLAAAGIYLGFLLPIYEQVNISPGP